MSEAAARMPSLARRRAPRITRGIARKIALVAQLAAPQEVLGDA
jgi:hypothetical protein